MDTKGHAEIAKDVGKDILADALEAIGRTGWRLEALGLGNWLTDVSQPVDPVVYARLRRMVLDFLDYVIRTIPSAPGYIPQRAKDWLIDLFTRLRQDADQATQVILGGRDSTAGMAFKKIFRVIGYFKFVHPWEDVRIAGPRPLPRMDYQSYLRIFDERYTQYYPHEHLDRYPDALSGQESQNGYAARRSSSTRTPAGRGTGRDPLPLHLYSYLVDDIEMAAGLLADIDLNWAAQVFDNSGGPGSDADPTFNLGLAKLGHVMHMVEDYFAHTNFLELALNAMPAPQRRGIMPQEDSGAGSAYVIFQRRLKRYTNSDTDGSESLDEITDEDHVVSGCFGFLDTLFSVRHIGEDFFKSREQSRQSRNSTDWTAVIISVLRDVMEQVERELPESQAVTPQQAADVARRVLPRMAGDGDPVQIAVTELLHTAPEEIRNDFYSSVGFFAAHPRGTKSVFAAFLFINALGNAVEPPAEFVRFALQYVGGALAQIPAWFTEPVANWLRAIIDRKLGRWRIGCHSLLAKDYASEDDELTRLYRAAMNLAKAVHWYIIKTLIRWSAPVAVPLSRRDVSASGPDQSNTVNAYELVDWLELLEFFLRHPYGRTGRWWAPVIRGGWTDFPGYNGSAAERHPRLPHLLVIATLDEVNDLIHRRAQNLIQAERRYTPPPA